MLPKLVPSLPELEAETDPCNRLNNAVKLLEYLLKKIDGEQGAETHFGQVTDRVIRHAGKFSRFSQLRHAIYHRNTGQHEPDKAELDRIYSAFADIKTGIYDLLPHVPADLSADVRQRRQQIEDPWNSVAERFRSQQIVRVIIKSFAKNKDGVFYGAFAELEPNVDGLIHNTQLAHHNVLHPNEVVAIGEQLDVMILGVDVRKRRISLSRKRLLPLPDSQGASATAFFYEDSPQSENVWKKPPDDEPVHAASSSSESAGMDSSDKGHRTYYYDTGPALPPKPPPPTENISPKKTLAISPQLLVILILAVFICSPCLLSTVYLFGRFISGQSQPPTVADKSLVPATPVDGRNRLGGGQQQNTPVSSQRSVVTPADSASIAQSKATNASFKRTEPFRETFVNVKDGFLPPGWTGSQSIGVRTSGKVSWITSSSSSRSQTVTTGPLNLGNEFECELWINPQAMSFQLNGDDPLRIDLNKYFGGEIVATIPDRPERLKFKLDNTWIHKLRIVKTERMCHIFTKDKKLVTQLAPDTTFSSMSFTLSPTAQVFGYDVHEYPRGLKTSSLPLVSNFSTYADGEIPSEWNAIGTVHIRKIDSHAWLETSLNTREIAYIRTPILDLPDRFCLECVLDFSDDFGDFRLGLEAVGPSEDVWLDIEGYFEKRVISLSDTDNVTIRQAFDKNRRPIPLSLLLERDGPVIKLSQNGNPLAVSPRFEAKRFHQVAIGLSNSVKLHDLRIWKTDVGKPPTPGFAGNPRVTELPANQQTLATQKPSPAEDGKPKKENESTTVWQEETSGGRFQITRQGTTLRVALLEGTNLRSLKATLHKDEQAEGTQYSGSGLIVYRDDSSRQERAIKMTVRSTSQPTRVIVTADEITFDKNGRERFRKQGKSQWLKIDPN